MSSNTKVATTISDHDKYMSSVATGSWHTAIYNAEQNPNRRLRFWAFNPGVASWHRDTSQEPSHFLRVANVGFTKKDRSVYFAPRPVRPVTVVAVREGAELGSAQVVPNEKLYVSFHVSGAVNVHGIRTEYLRIRDARALDDAVPLFTCGFSNFDGYEPESKPNESGVIVAASGPADWPIFVSVFALRDDVQLDEGKPHVVLSHSPWETVISVGRSRTRYLFAGWTSPPETFRNACGGKSADFVVLPRLPQGVSVRRSD